MTWLDDARALVELVALLLPFVVGGIVAELVASLLSSARWRSVVLVDAARR